MIKNQGYFIVFEGIDGAGSSTQAELLQKYFSSTNQESVISPEPTTGKIGQLLREFLAQQKYFADANLYDQQMAYLFAADRHYHLYNKVDGVYKLTGDNIHVISTRYYFSSLAYNAKNKREYDFVAQLNQHFPNPDLLIYLDIPVDLALARISDRPIKEIYETKEKLLKVRANFEFIMANYPDKLLRIDASQNPQVINQLVIDSLNSKLNHLSL